MRSPVQDFPGVTIISGTNDGPFLFKDSIAKLSVIIYHQVELYNMQGVTGGTELDK